VLCRGDEILALVRDVPHGEPEHRTVPAIGELDVHHPVAGMHQRHQVLVTILDVLHRAARLAREQRAHEEIGGTALVAEGAADVGADQAQARLRDTERLGENGQRQTRPLVVGPERVGVHARVVLGDGAEGLQRGGGVALDLEALAEHAVRPCERVVDVAVGQHVVPQHVRAELGVEEGRVRPDRGLRVEHDGQRLIDDTDVLERVLRGRAIDGGDRRDGLSGEAHAVGGQAPVAHRHRRGNERADRLGHRGRLHPREHGENAGQPLDGTDVDRHDARVGVRAPQHRAVQQSRPREVVEVHAASGRQPEVFFACQRATDPTSHGVSCRAACSMARTMSTHSSARPLAVRRRMAMERAIHTGSRREPSRRTKAS
jgi:hypothetical protein